MSATAKLAFIGTAMALNGLIMCLLPFTRSFELLVTLRALQFFALGAFITADASMLVYTMGPIKSRPFTNALHAAVGVGFLLGTFIVRPFLPEDSTANQDRDSVCGSPNATTTDDHIHYVPEELGGIDKIAWPFLIAGGWSVFSGMGYFILGQFWHIALVRSVINDRRVDFSSRDVSGRPFASASVILRLRKCCYIPMPDVSWLETWSSCVRISEVRVGIAGKVMISLSCAKSVL